MFTRMCRQGHAKHSVTCHATLPAQRFTLPSLTSSLSAFFHMPTTTSCPQSCFSPSLAQRKAAHITHAMVCHFTHHFLFREASIITVLDTAQFHSTKLCKMPYFQQHSQEGFCRVSEQVRTQVSLCSNT